MGMKQNLVHINHPTMGLVVTASQQCFGREEASKKCCIQ